MRISLHGTVAAVYDRRIGRSPSAAAAKFTRGQNSSVAFTLLEVMIAAGIFFMAIFAILALVSTNIRNARMLQTPHPDPSMCLRDLYITNKITEGSDHGDFGNAFPGYTWDTDVRQIRSNGLFQVDVLITKPGGGPNSISTLSVYMYKPQSAPGAGFAP